MRLLLDENVPRKLRQDLLTHDVYTVRFQQNLIKYPTPIIVLDTYTNAYPILKLIVPRLLEQLKFPLVAGATTIRL